MGKILGLDIGTNSIGWALVERDIEKGTGSILGAGVRIIPTDSELLSKFEAGQAASKNAVRRQARGARRLRQRYKLRRQRLVTALKILGWLPKEFQPGHQMPVSNQTLLEMKAAFGTLDVSDDWVVYYLRHKALTDPVDEKELAQILYHMNQRRGFKSNRKTDVESPEAEQEGSNDERRKRTKRVEIVAIQSIEDTGERLKGNVKFNVILKDGRSGTVIRKVKPDWEGKDQELEITWIPPTKREPEKYEFRLLNNSDADKWAKQKVAREEDIRRSGLQYPGNYYYHKLKENPKFLIKDVSIDRQFYIDELTAIFRRQVELNPVLNNGGKISEIAKALYSKNQEKQKEIRNNDVAYLFIRDIIYFQRPLRSKKSSVADCRLAKKNYVNPITGRKLPLKVAPSSSPIFQEFRIWQTVCNIRVLKRESRDSGGRLLLDKDVSAEYLDWPMLEALFELFDSRELIGQKEILKTLGLDDKTFMISLFRQSEEKGLPGNETKAVIRRQFKRAGYEQLGAALLSDHDAFYKLWHILYSLEDRVHIVNALRRQFNMPEDVAAIMSKIPAFRQQYCSLSHQAMQKLLPLMRCGRYWKWEKIDPFTRNRLERIMDGEFDESISDQVRDLFERKQIKCTDACQGMPVAMASYAVYGIHSERDTGCYERPDQVVPKDPLNLRNPLVEQVVNETLRLVKDIWKAHGRPFQIHIELARDLKKNAKERKEISERNTENENENRRIVSILRELNWGNPNSISDIERLKIWEQQAGTRAREGFKDIKFKRSSEPSREEIQRYKLWTEQEFISPYSGKPIPISKLFSREYDIDHIMPRSRFFDDSLDNKVVVESFLNKEKDNMTAMEYIRIGSVKRYEVLSPVDYEANVNTFFYGKKRRLLLSEDIPSGFSNRHMVDTRYINKKLNELLAPVSENKNDPVITTSGAITSELKSSWGMGEAMKKLVKWRFDRLEGKTNESYAWYEDQVDRDGKTTGKKVLRLKGYEKRIDHRHHTLDALVIACTTRAHIKYLNDLNSIHYHKEQRDDSLAVLPSKLLDGGSDGSLQSRKFRKPWQGFVQDTTHVLEGIVVSFKNDLRLYGKKSHKNWRYIQQPDGSFKKELKPVVDDQGNRRLSPYVRKSLHKATIAGKIQLREYESFPIGSAFKEPHRITDKKQREYVEQLLGASGGDVKRALKKYKEVPLKGDDGAEVKEMKMGVFVSYYVNRVDMSSGFDEKRIGKIPDVGLQRELLRHLGEIDQINANRNKDEIIDPFGSDGMEIFNRSRSVPISKVRIKEESGSKFEIRPGAYTEADKGTNLFFIVYESLLEIKDRMFESIPFRVVVEARRAGSDFVEERDGYRWFTLSPNDLVYMPDVEEDIAAVDWSARRLLSSKIYKLVSCNKGQAFFVPHTISKVIVDKVEFDSTNKMERALDGRMIKQYCVKLVTDRLGNIAPSKR